MKCIKGIVCLFLIATLLISCEQNADNIDLKICGSYSVPGMFSEDLKGNMFECEIIEQDSYGRILYKYTGKSVVTGAEETAIVICQKSDSKYVYFYEDLCYLYFPATQEAITTLKNTNDWGQPLEDEKMSRRATAVTVDLYIEIDSTLEYAKVRSTCCAELGISSDQIDELCIMDVDSSNKALYWLCVSRDGVLEDYIVMVNAAYDISFLPIYEKNINATDISAFKQQNDWDYGF